MQDKSYTHSTAETHQIEDTKYKLWKVRQLMCDVLRVQIQQEAVQEAYAHRFEAFKGVAVFPNSIHDESTITNLMPVRANRLHPHAVPMLNMRVKKVLFDQTDRFPGVMPNLYYVQLNIASCICKTHTINPTPQVMHWDRMNICGKVPINDVQLDECIVEILDANPLSPEKTFVGRGRLPVDKTLGYNMGRDVEFTAEIMNREKAIIGTMTLVLNIDVDEFATGFVADPKNLNFFEINRKVSNMKKIEMGLDAVPSVDSVEVHAAASVNSEVYASLSTLVGDLRGDGVEFIKLLTGDVTLNDLHRAGADVHVKYTQVYIYIYIYIHCAWYYYVVSVLYSALYKYKNIWFVISYLYVLPHRTCRTSNKPPPSWKRKPTGTGGSWTRYTKTSSLTIPSWMTPSRRNTKLPASLPPRRKSR